MKRWGLPITVLLGAGALGGVRLYVSTPMKFRRVDPTRRMGTLSRLYAAFGTLPPVVFLLRRVLFPLDPYLQRATRGRVSVALTLPTTVLETTGAKTGIVRRTVVMYFHDGDRVILLAVNSGAEKQPAWYYNLKAHPDVFLAGLPMRAREIDDEVERKRLLSLAEGMHPWPKFCERAGEFNRQVPVIELTQR